MKAKFCCLCPAEPRTLRGWEALKLFVNIVHQFPGRELPLQTASLSSLERASRNQYLIVVNCETQMCLFCAVFMQTPAWVLKFLCFFEVVVGKKFCVVLFSPFLMHLDVFSMTVCRKTFLPVRVLFCFCVCTGIGLQSFHPSAVFQYSLCSASALSIQGRRNSVRRERIVYFPCVWNSAV